MMTNPVAVAFEHSEIANKVFDDYVEACLNDPYNPLNWSEIDRLGKIANDRYHQLVAARHEALNPQECTCTPDLPDGRCFPLCDVCKADIDRKLGDSIPFGGK